MDRNDGETARGAENDDQPEEGGRATESGDEHPEESPSDSHLADVSSSSSQE